jgi:hypothetical protein
MADQFFSGLDPEAAPDPVSPRDGPSSPAGWAQVTPHGPGPAAYDIAAPLEDLAAAVEAAGRLSGAGIVYPQGPRQAEAQALLDSGQGYGAHNVISGFPDYESADIMPPADADNGGYGGA